MNEYTWMMAIVVFLALLLRGNKKGSRLYILLSCALMFCVMGLRDASLIGIDSASSYLHQFERLGAGSWSDLPPIWKGGNNTAFSYLMKLVYELTEGNYQTFIILISAFILLCLYHFISRYSVSPVQSFCYYWGLLLYIFMFSAEKQAIAMSIILLAFDAIPERKPVKFLILVWIASLFHFPALVFLPAYWIAKARIGNDFMLVLLCLLLVTYLFRRSILELMESIYGEEGDTVTSGYVRFLGNKVLIMIAIVAAGLLLRPPHAEDRLYDILLKFMGVSIIIQTFAGYSNVYERLADYYFQFAILYIPMVFEHRQVHEDERLPQDYQNLIKTAAPYVFSAFGIYRFAQYVLSAGPVFLPYRFFFS